MNKENIANEIYFFVCDKCGVSFSLNPFSHPYLCVREGKEARRFLLDVPFPGKKCACLEEKVEAEIKR